MAGLTQKRIKNSTKKWQVWLGANSCHAEPGSHEQATQHCHHQGQHREVSKHLISPVFWPKKFFVILLSSWLIAGVFQKKTLEKNSQQIWEFSIPYLIQLHLQTSVSDSSPPCIIKCIWLFSTVHYQLYSTFLCVFKSNQGSERSRRVGPIAVADSPLTSLLAAAWPCPPPRFQSTHWPR